MDGEGRAVSFLQNPEKFAHRRQAEPGIGPLRVPFGHPVGQLPFRRTVVHRPAADRKSDQVIGIVPPGLEAGQVFSEARLAFGVSLMKTELQVGKQVMLAVPDEDFRPVGGLPVEGIRLAKRGSGPRLVDADGEIMDSRLAEDLGGSPAEPGDVVVHRRPKGEGQGPAEILGRQDGPDELLVAEQIRKLDIPARKLHSAGTQQAGQRLDLLRRPALDVIFQGPGDLDVPAEFRLVGIGLGRPAELDDPVQVFGLVLGRPGRKIGIAEVRVGMGPEVNRPFPLGRENKAPGGRAVSHPHRKPRPDRPGVIGEMNDDGVPARPDLRKGLADLGGESPDPQLSGRLRSGILENRLALLKKRARFLDEEDRRPDIQLEPARGRRRTGEGSNGRR